MKNFRRDNRTFLIVSGAIFVITAVAWLLYAVWGHQLVESMYNGESIGFLNRVITEQSTRPVEFFLQRADEIFYKEVLFFPLCNLFFYFILYKSFKYLLRNAEGGAVRFPDRKPQYLNTDLLIATAVYCIFTVVLFSPYLNNITSHLIGPPEDNQKYLWNMWWGHRAAFDSATRLDFSDYIFFPEGGSLLYNDYSWYNLSLSFMLRPFFSPVTAYNLLILHTFVFAGIGAFMLVKYLTGSQFAALIGGFIFAFNPSHLMHAMHHVNISSIQFMPFFVLFSIRTFKNGTRKDLALASIFLLLNALCDWHYLIFAIYFMGFCYVYLALERKRLLLPEVLIKAGIMIGGTVLVLSPWLFRMIILGLTRSEITGAGHGGYVVDAVGPLLPHTYHILASLPIIQDVYYRISGNVWESCAYLGLVNLMILAFAFRRLVSKMAIYLCGILTFFVLSMGTYVHILGAKMPIMLPYSIIKYIPLLSNVRAPARNIVFVYLFLAIVIGLALKLLLDRARIKKRNYILLSFLVGLLILDYHSTSNEMTEVYLPSCYSAIDHVGDFGILDLPAGWTESAKYMMYQTLHGIPIVQGVIPRKIGKSLQDHLEDTDLSIQKRQLIENSVKYIVIHKRLLSPGNALDISQYKETYTTIYEDENNIVYEVY